MLDRERIIERMSRWNDAWNDHDLDRVMEFLHDEVEFENWTSGRVRGKEALRQAWTSWFTSGGEFIFHRDDLFVDGEEQKLTVTWELEWPSTEKGYEGKPEKRRGLDVIHFKDGKIIKKLTYSAQTQRSLGNFKISSERMPLALVHALALVKKAAALVNLDLAALDARKGAAIVQAADEVLRRLGALLSALTRQSDVACRYGGDEFVVLMPGATLDQALARAEQWRTAFAEAAIAALGSTGGVTLSAGVAAFPEQASGAVDLVRAADAALYAAKAAGRDRVLSAPLRPEVAPAPVAG